MNLVMFSPQEMGLERGWPGRIDGEDVIQLAAQTIQVFFTAGGALREHAVYPLAQVDLRAPVLYPPSVRFFDGGDFAFGNTAAIVGPEDDVRWPEGSNDLRAVPSVAAVIGDEGAIGGFTGANAWTAPDLPGAKARDFAISIGPVVVTADETDPRWSPDGRRLAFMSDRIKQYEIYVAPSGGGPARAITHTQGGAHDPAWSPNGHQIAFTTFIGGQWQIGVVNSAGGGQRILTSSSGDNTNPDWSPDGKSIIFESTRDNVSAIYVMKAAGGGQRRLS